MTNPVVVQGTPVSSGTTTTTTTKTTYYPPPGGNLPIAEGKLVTPPEPPRPGIPALSGFELWVRPEPNYFKDGMPVFEVRYTERQTVLTGSEYPWLTCCVFSPSPVSLDSW